MKDNRIVKIEDFPKIGVFLVYCLDSKLIHKVGLIVNIPGKSAEVKLITFTRVIGRFSGVGLLAFQIFNSETKKNQLLSIFYSENTKFGDNTFILVSVFPENSGREPKKPFFKIEEDNKLMRMLYGKSVFSNCRVISVKAVWVETKKDYIIHIVYTG